MFDRLHRLLIPSSLVLLACCVLWAADPPPKDPPKRDENQKELEDYQFFFGKPANIPEFWAAIQYEKSVGRTGVSAMFIEQMLAFAKDKLDDKKRAEEWEIGRAHV